MNVAPVYRAVLKNLSRACKTRPHYVQDVRFLLSLPLFSHHSEATVVPGTTSSATSPLHHSTTSAPQDQVEHMHLLDHTSVENYLRRPPSMCYPIDADTLFALCYADLQSALRQPPQSDGGGGGVNPVAQQILRYRNLLWLRDRLARVLSAKTTEHLATSLSIADGPDNDDFIPDAFFETPDSQEGQQAGSGGGAASVTTAPKSGSVGVASGALGDEDSKSTSSKEASKSTPAASPSSSSAAKGSSLRSDTIVSAASDEGDADVVFSAGAIGQQGEMFVLRHREAFPMAAHFLSGFPTVPASELASCAHQQAALIRLVRDKYPTTVTCDDGHVSLSVAVEPFDPEYRTREHAGMGYFATAHRQFRVQFSLQPLALDAHDEEGEVSAAHGDANGSRGVAERTEVLVVNSYFTRLDMEVMQVVEEVGYVHSRDVLRMLRERDYGDHFSDYMGHSVAEALGEGGEQKSVKASPMTSESAEQAAAAATVGGAVRAPEDNARVFSLYFVNPTDAPMVLKGMLYYKLGKRNRLAKTPIRCIPFGFVLLEA